MTRAAVLCTTGAKFLYNNLAESIGGVLVRLCTTRPEFLPTCTEIYLVAARRALWGKPFLAAGTTLSRPLGDVEGPGATLKSAAGRMLPHKGKNSLRGNGNLVCLYHRQWWELFQFSPMV